MRPSICVESLACILLMVEDCQPDNELPSRDEWAGHAPSWSLVGSWGSSAYSLPGMGEVCPKIYASLCHRINAIQMSARASAQPKQCVLSPALGTPLPTISLLYTNGSTWPRGSGREHILVSDVLQHRLIATEETL